jgi:hypothetical protein
MARSTIDYFDEETARVDKLINKKQSIEKLLEYRFSLISAVVTGKIRVNDEYGMMNDEKT